MMQTNKNKHSHHSQCDLVVITVITRSWILMKGISSQCLCTCVLDVAVLFLYRSNLTLSLLTNQSKAFDDLMSVSSRGYLIQNPVSSAHKYVDHSIHYVKPADPKEILNKHTTVVWPLQHLSPAIFLMCPTTSLFTLTGDTSVSVSCRVFLCLCAGDTQRRFIFGLFVHCFILVSATSQERPEAISSNFCTNVHLESNDERIRSCWSKVTVTSLHIYY